MVERALGSSFLMIFLASRPPIRQSPAVVQGFSGDQLFFLAYAQSWRNKLREPALRQQIVTDPHAPDHYRANTVRNLDAWYKAFGAKPGQSLFLTDRDRVRVW